MHERRRIAWMLARAACLDKDVFISNVMSSSKYFANRTLNTINEKDAHKQEWGTGPFTCYVLENCELYT